LPVSSFTAEQKPESIGVGVGIGIEFLAKEKPIPTPTPIIHDQSQIIQSGIAGIPSACISHPASCMLLSVIIHHRVSS
jgi:hypothetical protein